LALRTTALDRSLRTRRVLADGLATGLADDLEAWTEYERGSHNRTQVTISRDLRRRYRLADEEIAETDFGSDDLIALPAETWSVIRGCAEQLLTVAETDGLAGALGWLTARQLEWVWAGPIGADLNASRVHVGREEFGCALPPRPAAWILS
jgi:hypothetical protein